MNNSEGQTQEPVGGMKWEDVQILAKKHAEQIIEMGWRDNPDKDDIIADFISGYVSAPPPAPIKTDKQDDFNIAVDKAWEMHCRSIPEDSYNEEEYAELVAGKEIMFMTDFIEACHTYLYLPATPSPVGIDVEALAKEYADDIWESVPMEVQYIYLNLISAFKAGYSASLPQSSNLKDGDWKKKFIEWLESNRKLFNGLPASSTIADHVERYVRPHPKPLKVIPQDDTAPMDRLLSESSTEEEKDLWEEVVKEVEITKYEDVIHNLQSQFKISKR